MIRKLFNDDWVQPYKRGKAEEVIVESIGIVRGSVLYELMACSGK